MCELRSAIPRAVYLLSPTWFDYIYGPDERAALAQRVDIAPSLLTEDMYRAAGGRWPEVEFIFSGWGMPRVDADFLDRFPRLRAIFYGAGSIKDFATEEMWNRGIRVTSAAQANAVPVAEFALSQILFSLKNGWQQVFFIRSHRRYPPRCQPPGAWGSTVGLISLGMIGQLVAERLRSFDLRVIAYDPIVSPSVAQRLNVELVALEDIFFRSDVVSCHAPHLPETENMIGKKHFNLMKFNATFINTARGAVVNEPELIEALRDRPDLMAVLDVT